MTKGHSKVVMDTPKFSKHSRETEAHQALQKLEDVKANKSWARNFSKQNSNI